jgi:L-fuconolactonase
VTVSYPLRVRADWLALHSEEVLEPELPIIDAHHHLWDRPAWRYLLDEFLADINSGHRIAATVYVQCFAMHRKDGLEALRPVGETEFANGIAAMSASGNYGETRICDGIVAYADLRLVDEIEHVLDAHAAHGSSRFKGVRQISAWDKNPEAVNPDNLASEGMLSDPRFRAGFASLAPRGLSFDAFLFHTQLKELIDLARVFPSTRIVLNHMGTPLGIAGYQNQRAKVFRDWASDMKQLSTCENVVVKLGGLGMRPVGMGFAEHSTPLTSERLAELSRPEVDPIIETDLTVV